MNFGVEGAAINKNDYEHVHTYISRKNLIFKELQTRLRACLEIIRL
jgi:flagellin-specific chaperone FliS